jgi:4-hydroxy-2-oxoheptanedioate aldolase
MRRSLVILIVGLLLSSGAAVVSTSGPAVASTGPEEAAAQDAGRLNPVIDLLAQGEPVFGVYAPRNRRARAGRGQTAVAESAKTPADLAREAVAYASTDFLFDGSMEGGLERALPAFTAFTEGWVAAGPLVAAPSPRLTHPLIVKSPELGPGIAEDIAKQLDLGVSGVMFPHVENAEQLREALAAMRFRSHGGTRPDEDLGVAPARWGMTAEEYRRKADLWPLNPEGELINWTIIESQEGLDNVREIAAVPGIGVLWPGAGTLRGLFSSTNDEGERVLDQEAWEAAIQQVLAACKEFDVACGFPAGPSDIEMRMEQGFEVFVMSWGEAGFRTIDIGKRAAGRSETP